MRIEIRIFERGKSCLSADGSLRKTRPRLIDNQTTRHGLDFCLF
jgi:hypothetical protein